MTAERLPGDFGANWSPLIVTIVVVGLVLIGGAAYYLPLRSAQQAVAQRLIDPGAAQFRDVRRGSDAVCGEVSGKNRFGAYVGYERFIVTGGGAVYLDSPSERAASLRWTRFC